VEGHLLFLFSPGTLEVSVSRGLKKKEEVSSQGQCPADCAVRTAIIRLPSSPYEARSLLRLDLSLGMEDRETRRGAIRGLVVDDDRVRDVLTRQGYSRILSFCGKC
jgi:hypothetical protein